MSHHSSERSFPTEDIPKDAPQAPSSAKADEQREFPTEEPAIADHETHERAEESEESAGENGAPHTHAATMSDDGAADDGSNAMRAEFLRMKGELEAARSEHEQRVREIMHDHPFEGDMYAMPSLEKLRSERARLTETVRHHKDEQDSLALDIEGQEGASEVYQLAARVQRMEHFADHARQYTEETLPQDIERMIEEDRHQSNAELCSYIQELQNKRANTLKKVVSSQENMKKMPQRQNGAAGEEGKADAEEDPQERKAVEHVLENRDESGVLQQKIRKFRSMKTKMQADILKEKNDFKKMEEKMQNHIRASETANARDARQVKEMNDRHAALTTNSELLMNQLNVEHYGFDNAPTTKQLLKDREEREATPEPTPAEQQKYDHNKSDGSHGSHQSRSNSTSALPPTVTKPPLVAMKRTESQRSRESAAREEREEAAQAHRRGSATASYESSRRQSLSKPPLVVSRSTASQQSHDNDIRQEPEEL